MTATALDAALRNALRQVNSAFVALPPQLRDRLEVDVPDADEHVTRALRSGDQAAALCAIDRWRTSHLDAIREAGRSTRCRCDSPPMAFADEHDEVRCARCGREAA